MLTPRPSRSRDTNITNEDVIAVTDTLSRSNSQADLNETPGGHMEKLKEKKSTSSLRKAISSSSQIPCTSVDAKTDMEDLMKGVKRSQLEAQKAEYIDRIHKVNQPDTGCRRSSS